MDGEESLYVCSDLQKEGRGGGEGRKRERGEKKEKEEGGTFRTEVCVECQAKLP